MKNLIYVLILTCGLLSCKGQTTENADTKSADTLQTNLPAEQPSNIFIKDKSKYSQVFIDDLTKNYKEPVKIIDNYIVLGSDTTFFPNDLALNQATIFKGTKGNNNYKLTLTRTHETTLNFTFIQTDKDGKILNTQVGEAVLGAMFFLAAEEDEDETNETTYGAYQYGKTEKDCWLSVRVGIGKDDNGKKRAKIIFGCQDSTQKTLSLDQCPTLRTE